MEYKLSICITIYNQIDILKWNLDNLLQYKNHDVQFVVSDNCSQDNIKGLVESYNDTRIKYCKTERNVGQDGNILNAFKNADSNYVFLLRARDTVFPEKITEIMNQINEFPNFAYGRFSAVDQYGNPRLKFDSKIFTSSITIAKIIQKIPIHPSGELYNLSYIDDLFFRTIQNYENSFFPEHKGFIVHRLINLYLSQKGSFFVSDKIVWLYPLNEINTVSSSNTSIAGDNIYSPKYVYPVTKCLIDFIINQLNDSNKKELLRSCIRLQSYHITYGFKFFNKDPIVLKHYNCKPERYNSFIERYKFYFFIKKNSKNYKKEWRCFLLRETFFSSFLLYYVRIFMHFFNNILKLFCRFPRLKEFLIQINNRTFRYGKI